MSIHIPTDHAARIALAFTDNNGDSKCENTFYVVDPTDNLFSDPAGFCTQVYNAAVTNLIPQLSNNVHINNVVFEDVRSLPFAGADFPQTPAAGTLVSTQAELPADNAFSVKRLTGNVGRSGRGRWYWPIWVADYLASQNALSATRANAIVAALTAFQAGVEGGTYPCQMVVVSLQTGGAPRVSGFAQPIISWAYTDLTVDNQRRRLPGRGR